LQKGETIHLYETAATNKPTVKHPDTYMDMEQQWNNTDRGKLKNSEKNLSQ
jgi:hypothetical protein